MEHTKDEKYFSLLFTLPMLYYHYLHLLNFYNMTNIPTKKELLKMDGVRVRAVTDKNKAIEWEICIDSVWIYILHNNAESNWSIPKNMRWYGFWWILNYVTEDDYSITGNITSLEIIEQWEEKKNIKHTYEVQYTRSDGVIFTKDTIWGKKIEDLTREKTEALTRVREINALLQAHKAKF